MNKISNLGMLQIGNRENYTKTKKLSVISTINVEHDDDNDSRLKKTLFKNKHLVSIEENETHKKPVIKKKEIISYTANRDTLFIPVPERAIRPVDIKTNLVEDEKKTLNADIGIQIDEIAYVNQEKPYIPQKIGKDIGVQIEDGDLFNFDIDVEPLLTVLVGKILEQTDQELTEESEINNLRDTKAAFIRKFRAQKEEIKKLEEEEIKRKKENDDLRKRRRLEKISKIDMQQKLMSRVFSKSYLQTMIETTVFNLEKRGLFKNYTNLVIKDAMNGFIKSNTEMAHLENIQITNTLSKLQSDLNSRILNSHSDKIKARHELIQGKKDEKIRLKLEEEERIKKELEAKQERKRVRKIKRIREEIKKAVFDNPTTKSDYHQEDISEIDNYGNEGPYSKIIY
jgi:hypothetical protein